MYIATEKTHIDAFLPYSLYLFELAFRSERMVNIREHTYILTIKLRICIFNSFLSGSAGCTLCIYIHLKRNIKARETWNFQCFIIAQPHFLLLYLTQILNVLVNRISQCIYYSAKITLIAKPKFCSAWTLRYRGVTGRIVMRKNW